MPSRKTLRVHNREKTRQRRARARAAGMCVLCFVNPGTLREACALGEPGGNWCTAARPHTHDTAPMATCASCRDRKNELRRKEQPPPIGETG